MTSRTSRDVRLGLTDSICAHTPAAMAQAAEVKPKSLGVERVAEEERANRVVVV